MRLDVLSVQHRESRAPKDCACCGTAIDYRGKYVLVGMRLDGTAFQLRCHSDCWEITWRLIEAAYQEYDVSVLTHHKDLLLHRVLKSKSLTLRDEIRGYFPHAVCRVELYTALHPGWRA